MDSYNEHKKEMFNFIFDSMKSHFKTFPSVFNDGEDKDLIYIRNGDGVMIYYPTKKEFYEGCRASFEALHQDEVKRYLQSNCRFRVITVTSRL